jgi:hypothetical protein
MQGIHGILLVFSGFLHIMFGFMPVVYQREWQWFVRYKLWSQVSLENDRAMAAFWFVIAGPFMIMMGLLLYELESAGLNLPLSFGIMFLLVSCIGSFMSPRSGFTLLLLPQSIYYLVDALQRLII